MAQDKIKTIQSDYDAATSLYLKSIKKSGANLLTDYTSDKKMSQGLNLLSQGLNTLSVFANRSNVEAVNKQYGQQAELIDANTKNQEAILYSNFKNAISDLQTISAAKNVDIRSQGVQSSIVSSGMNMGQDLALQYTQNNLTKGALNLKKAINNYEQEEREFGAIMNMGISIAGMLI